MTIVFLIGLGAFFIAEFAKQFIGTYVISPVPAPLKFSLVALAAAGMTLLLDVDLGGEAVAFWLAGCGAAAFLHRTHRAFGAWGDVARATVITAAGRRPRP